ncbi:Tyrosine-protein phosphatase 10D [Eumeta japonica]|uniref:protein-tyrosine-phosphatase n=1 Tax=Eumeta variegata TaxID=151549 RepID=A0A4C1T1Y8_EUMVA|nr:Tyrosine-protein phosphatase 10D [Eumeta japonica]
MEGAQAPSNKTVMWKKQIVQANYSVAFLAFLGVLTILVVGVGAADLVIEIPGGGGGEAEGARYRLDYRPPEGSPAPNFTVPARASTINFQGLPGTKYHFMLYYSNATFADLLTWNQTIITAPEPPTNLTVTANKSKQATISWRPPAHGEYTGFRFRVVPLTARVEGGARNVSVEAGGGWSYTLRDLFPGATYQLHAFTVLHDKESAAYASRNFTTKPNTPGKFIVWFRNETTLLVLWQPPYPPGAYSHYKVSIRPPDAREPELFVEKEGEPPGPAQAAFKGLVPGRAYNISVQTISEDEISAPTTAQYRTVPLRPLNVTVDPTALAETSFRVSWSPPSDRSEFERYQVTLSGARRLPAIVRTRDEPTLYSFDGLDPGASYTVTVKTMSGKVTSWPSTAELTLKPLPVRDLRWQHIEVGDAGSAQGVRLWWASVDGSTQEEYKVSYHEVGPSRDDSNSLVTPHTNVTLEALLPGRNYSISVQAVSHGVESNESSVAVATRPLAPVVKELVPTTRGLRLSWRSDVNSKQDSYQLRYRRADHNDSAHSTEYITLETVETGAVLEGLFPGAVYELQVAALSHGLLSERYTLYKPVLPLPAIRMWVERETSNSVLVRWRGPDPADSAVGEYVLRYRTRQDPKWIKLPPLLPNTTEAEIVDMTHGERYTIQLDTGSATVRGADNALGDVVESGQPLSADHTVRPNPVSNVAPLVDARNMTLEWPRPEGRVEWYSLEWWRDEQGDERSTPHRANLTAEGATVGPRTVRALIDGLEPGTQYRLTIATHSNELASELFTMHARTRPLIQSEMTIVTERSDEGNSNEKGAWLKVVYTPTPAEASRFDTYRFALEGEQLGEGDIDGSAEDTDPQTVEKDARDETRRLVFHGLVPGRLYNVTMWTVSHNVSSHPVQRQARLNPRPITRLEAAELSSRFVTLTWDRPRGVYTDFQVQYILDENELRSRSTSERRLKVDGLRPYTNYTFTVEVRAGTPATLLTLSTGTSTNFRTLEAAPGPLPDFQPKDSKPNEMTFTWSLPEREHNGVLRRFVIEWEREGDGDVTRREFSPDTLEGTLTDLIPGDTYVFRIHAETDAGAGPERSWKQRMAIAAPPKPDGAALPVEVCRTPSTVAVRFRSDYFSAANGNVTAYTLVVAERPADNVSATARLPSWRDVQRYSVWPPYQVTEPYYPFQSRALEDFTIGSERCDTNTRGQRAYCNGPLKPGTRYYVKLRAFTAPDKFTDTAYTVVYTEVDNTAWVIGASVCGALALCGVVGALVIRRRRRASRASPHALSNGAGNCIRSSRPVHVADFVEHYRIMSADSDFRFSEEFEELKLVGRDQPCTAADLPCNRPKNRFTNILPYDHSRFKLQPVDDEEGSDYINANFVPGHNSPREFIVTQGPLHCTRDDFWRMCWESGSRAIVMLTRCVEKGREKCDHYWPYDTRPVYYGDIAVTTLNESHYPDWTITEMMVCRGSEQRVLKHFHFTTWPDFGVPSPPTALARFVRAFRERCPPDQRPVVVHCSAGVGRSGTFITLDRALQQLAAHADTLDVFGMVYAMRRERVWMVQTEQQYICIHQCLVAVLEGQDLAVPPPHPLPHHHHLNQAFEDDEGIAESGM